MQAPVVVPPAESFGDALRASLAGALSVFLAALPRLLGFAVVLLVGWLLSSLLARAVRALLNAVRFNDLARRSGLAGFVHNMGVRTDSSGVIAIVAKWFVRLIALVVAFDLLGLPAVSAIFEQLLLWLPNLVVAVIILVLGGLAANAGSRLVRGATAEAGFTNPDVLATVAKIAIWSFAAVVAVSQLGIATTIINTLLIGVVGALALAAGLAFGLGGRDRAADLLDRLAHQIHTAGPQLDLAIESSGLAEPVEFVPGWKPRSGVDRRRVPRPGDDRRAVG
ncbi:MAG TPA: hypothetical protein VEB59_02395 [Gemmatimonadales bacterium]|nr:hypothetical protein [Gemmatimonadales bacterium]